MNSNPTHVAITMEGFPVYNLHLINSAEEKLSISIPCRPDVYMDSINFTCDAFLDVIDSFMFGFDTDEALKFVSPEGERTLKVLIQEVVERKLELIIYLKDGVTIDSIIEQFTTRFGKVTCFASLLGIEAVMNQPL